VVEGTGERKELLLLLQAHNDLLNLIAHDAGIIFNENVKRCIVEQ
jgi:hypothetical protein